MKTLRTRRALLWHRVYYLRHRLLIWIARRGAVAASILLLSLIVISAFWIPKLTDDLQAAFPTEERLQGLRSLFLAIGGALLGATAIVSSLVLFSMQVNVERMPHGLFRRLSADRRLLSAFAAAFLLAIFIATLSVVPDRTWIGVATFAAAWATGLVLILFLYAYRRALVLINPLRQLGIVVARTRREFQAWVRRADRAAPLLADSSPPSRSNDPFAPKHDLTRVAYFQANAHWTEGAKQAVRYVISFARRFAEQGDHEVSAAAMNAIIAINAAYVEAKGKTFFTYQFMFDNPLTSDSFVNDTLEHLRQTARVAVSRGDEQQIEQAFRAFAALVRVYAAIDYASLGASKTHAHLAAGYLTGEVERIVAHNMPDVLMEGVRLVGQCADILLATEGPEGIRTLVQKIGIIGCCGIAKEDYRPVTSTSVEQLARMSFDLLRTRSRELKFVAEEIRSSMSFLAKLFLAVPDTPLSRTHSTFLGPYYSASSTEALPARLVTLANAVVGAEANDENARQVIANLEDWADGIYRTEKELLLEAIKRRSQFTFDMIHWISQVTTILLAVSNAKACSEHDQEELRKHALWLISVLSFVPDDIETVKFVETFRMTETLFDAAVDAHNRDCPEIAADIAGLLISWTFSGGQYHSGWAILERSMYGLSVLALLEQTDFSVGKLKAEISKRLAAGGLPDQEVRDHAAREIRGRAATLYREGHWSSSIERGMARVDHEKLKPLLEELADLISPGTAGQAASQHFF
ncbi:MAG: hypothetical protein CVT81_00415 [Alphaproteobacteria bacterium HGW-Alphaproteobacteria-3]|nr:MAG: hypothetical protein CVT81_00415 [Alphaproteobacteria bacterium HGW-Alphaproteobacteria-3]